MREGVLSFDEILDGQRQVIYQDRMEALNASAAEFDELFSQWAAGVVDDIVDGSKGDGDKVRSGEERKMRVGARSELYYDSLRSSLTPF